MTTLTSVGPIIINGSMQSQNHPTLMPMMANSSMALSAQYLAPNVSPYPHQISTYRNQIGSMPGSSSTTAANNPSTPSNNSAMNRSQRCGVCRGCQCKPCGTCTYCQDSPQFGGPGVKKQSCIERRCLRVLENRLQRDAPTFKARIGCNNCDDCRMPDCQVCLVCLDKRFFDNRYMTGALCAKKRCNNATTFELPPTIPTPERNMIKRHFDSSQNYEFMMAKRRTLENEGNSLQTVANLVTIQQSQSSDQAPSQQQNQGPPQARIVAINGMPNGMDANSGPRHQVIPSVRVIQHHGNSNGHMGMIVSMPSGASNDNGNQTSDHPQVLPPQQLTQQQQQQSTMPQQTNGHHVITFTNNSNQPHPRPGLPPASQMIQTSNGGPGPEYAVHHMQFANNMGLPGDQMTNNAHFAYFNSKYFAYPKYEYYDCGFQQDPYVPPSYTHEKTGGIVLQPL